MINTHLFDASYKNVGLESVKDSMSSLIEVISEKKNNGISRFTYDCQFYETIIEEGKNLNQVLSSSQELMRVLGKTLMMCNELKEQIIDFDSYKAVIQTKYGIDSKIDEYSFWGVSFPSKNINELTCVIDIENYYNSILKKNINNNNFSCLKNVFFKNLHFLNSIDDEIRSINGKIFNTLVGDLKKLDNYCNGIDLFNIQICKESTCIDISGESETVRKSPKKSEERSYIIPNVGVITTYNHIKVAKIRVYVYFDQNSKYMWVTEIGKHKSTAKY